MKLSRKQRYNLGRELESRFRSVVDKPGMHEIRTYYIISVLYLFAIANSKLIRRETDGENAQLGFQR